MRSMNSPYWSQAKINDVRVRNREKEYRSKLKAWQARKVPKHGKGTARTSSLDVAESATNGNVHPEERR